MSTRRISTMDMLVSRSALQETMAELDDEYYACTKCGVEFANPIKFVCNYCTGKLVKVTE